MLMLNNFNLLSLNRMAMPIGTVFLKNFFHSKVQKLVEICSRFISVNVSVHNSIYFVIQTILDNSFFDDFITTGDEF